MKIKKRLAAIAWLVVMFGLIAGNYLLMPMPDVPRGEDTALTEFSAELAMEHINRIALKPRPAGSAYNEEVRNYIKSYIEKLGITVQEDIHTVKHKYEDRMVDVHNLIVRLQGSDSTGTLLYLSHYDSVDEGPGANDNASGVSIMLELIKILEASTQVKNDVMFLFTDGEEYGVLGSTAYVNTHAIDEIELVINLEARGNKGRSMLFETQENNYGMVEEFIQASTMPYGYSFINDIYKILPNYTDYEPFKSRGEQGLNLAYIEGLNVYHNEKDNTDSIVLATQQHHGQNALELLQHFGNLDFQAIENTNSQAVYFNTLGYQMMLYSVDNNLMLSLAAVLLFVAVAIVTWRKRATSLRNILSWLITIILLIILAFILGTALLVGKAIYDGLIPFMITMIIIGTSILVIIISAILIKRWRLGSRWKARLTELTLLDCTLSNLLVGTILTCLSYAFTPSSNYLFMLPVLLQSMSVLIYYGAGTKPFIRWICSLVIVPILMILYPLWFVIGLSIGWMGLPFLCIVLVITAPFLIPIAFLPSKMPQDREGNGHIEIGGVGE